MMPKGLKNTPPPTRQTEPVFRSKRPDIRGEVDVVVVQRDAMWHGVALG